MVLARAGERLAPAWAGSELLLVDGLGHRRILSDPAMVERVLAFLGERPQVDARRSRRQADELVHRAARSRSRTGAATSRTTTAAVVAMNTYGLMNQPR